MLPESCLAERGGCHAVTWEKNVGACVKSYSVLSKESGFLFWLSITLFLSVREEIEKQKSKERYMKLHLEGKTDQARADLARLAIIKKQREDAAKKRDELRKGEEMDHLVLWTVL